MVGRVRAAAALIAIAAIFAIACNALTGVGDLQAGALGDDGGVDGSNALLQGSDASGGTTSGAPGTSGFPGSSGFPTSSGFPGSSSGSFTCESTGGTCAPAAPDGWQGPYLVFDRTTSTASCPPTLTDRFDLGAGTPTANFACPACKCEAPKGGTCTATLTMWTDTTCTDTATQLGSVAAGTCTPNTSGAAVGAKFQHTLTGAGTCAPALDGAPTVDKVSWTTTYSFCGSKFPIPGKCTADTDRCLPPADGAKICIFAPGELTCPAPWVTSKITAYGKANDSRVCDASSCHCADPTGVTCGGQYKSFTNTTCATNLIPPFGQGTPRPVDACFTLDNNQSAKAASGPTAQGGSCTPSGTPTMTGTLVPADERTTCCL